MRVISKAGILCLAVIFVSFLVWDQTKETLPSQERFLLAYQTSTSRTSSSNNLCQPYSSRDILYTESDYSQALEYQASVNAQINIDGLTLLKKYSDGNTNQASDMIKENSSGFARFVAAFAVGLVIFYLMWPFLLCCCICPSRCPSKCCRHPEDVPYTKFQLFWPTAVLLIALLLVIAASIFGLAKTSYFGDSSQKMTCSAAITLDDILNGNVTADGNSYFIGLNPLSIQLNLLKNNLNNIDGNLSLLRSGSPNGTLQQALDDCQTAMDDTKLISNNDAAGNPLVLSYNTPIDNAISSGSISSSFIPILGSFSGTNGLVWNLYSSIQSIFTELTKLRANAQNFHNQISNVNANIDSVKTNIDSISTTINDKDSSIGNRSKDTQNLGKNGNMGIQLFYGVIIGISCLAFIAALATCCLNKYRCRYLIYFTCIILFFAGLIGFGMATALSVLIPPITWGCQYYSDSLQSEAKFKANFGFAFDNKTLYQISACLPFGNGDIISRVGGLATNGINNLTSVITQLGSFNVTPYKNSMNGNMTAALQLINSFALSEIPDISDSSTISIISGLANPSSGSFSNCNSALTGDSWVPSNNQNANYPTISCSSNGGSTGNGITCSSGVSSTSGGCLQCMDTTTSLHYYRDGSHALMSDLSSRYGASCTFNIKLNNVWMNYYKVKDNALGPTVNSVASPTGVLPRTNTVKTKLDTLILDLDPAIPNLFSNIINNMNSINTLIDPKYGMLAGLNCSLIGQDLVRFQKSACGSFYNNIYLMRLAFGIISYGILVALCCMVCTGVRHYKKSLSQLSPEYVNKDYQVPDSHNNLHGQKKFLYS